MELQRMKKYIKVLVPLFLILGSLFFFLGYRLARDDDHHKKLKATADDHGGAILPPRGWNSYDSFCWTISEQEFLQSAAVVSQRLLPHGYEYVVVDFLWYRKLEPGASTNSRGFDVIDEWGRVVPDPGRWPSSEGGEGFSKVAEMVHSMGLKFGIHIMRGISVQAYDANSPILDISKGAAYEEDGRKWTARDIGIKEKVCGWMPEGFMSVNTSLGAAKAFLTSIHHQYAAEWNVDFIKHDCVFGDDLSLDEITFVSQILKQADHPVTYSLSPGTSVTPSMAKQISGLANMYRITADDWDSWRDVSSHFNVTRDFADAEMIGGSGLQGKSWPDLDMLPLGWLTDPDSNVGPHRQSWLTPDEQRTQMTLWSMAKSPLMFGGDVRKLDNATFDIITHPVLLEIDHFSSNNSEFPLAAGGFRSWIATGRAGEIYLAFFNLNSTEKNAKVSVKVSEIAARVSRGRKVGSCEGREVWSGKDMGVMNESVSMAVDVHGCALFVLNCTMNTMAS
ncbi:unnamed protein product [Linum grandiflorum]